MQEGVNPALAAEHFLPGETRMTDDLRQSRVSRAEALARQLEAEIVGERLAAGHRVGTKEDLRRRFAVAVPTVNEAIRMLETRGLITVRPGPGGGVFVATRSSRVRSSQMVLGFGWTTSETADSHVVRNALEPLVIREAALYRTPEDVADMRRMLADLKDSFGDARLWWGRNWDLHRRIAKILRKLRVTTRGEAIELARHG